MEINPDLTDVEIELLRQMVRGKRLVRGNPLTDYRYYTFDHWIEGRSEVSQEIVSHLLHLGYLVDEPLTYESQDSKYNWINLTPLARYEVQQAALHRAD